MNGPAVSPPRRFTFHLIPHTHWDREWYLTRAGFQARLVPVLDAALSQLARDRRARFVLDGQTVLLEDYLEVRPESEARVVDRVRRDGLEIGPWYVLSDLLIPSAQSLYRNLEEGAHDSARFGKRLDVLYSPDAFGHPAGLPTLAAQFGIKYAVVRRGLGRPLVEDRDLYRWEAAGGESVLVYHLPAGGYDLAIDLADAGADLARRWVPLRKELVGRAVTDQIAVFLGADHHPMVEGVSGFRARLQALEKNHTVRVSGLGEFFLAVERARPEAPVIRGELRRIDGHAWVLQGAHSTRARMKRRHSRVELLLSRIAAPLARLAQEQGGRDRAGLVRLAWRSLLQCQFHDTLAGTTSDAVQREQEVRFDTVEALCREIATGSLGELVDFNPAREPERPGAASPRLALCNPSERSRAGIMTAEVTFFRKDVLVGPPSGRRARVGPGYQPFALESAAGKTVPVQVLGVRRGEVRRDAERRYPDQDEVDRVFVAFEAPAVPRLGARALTPRVMRRPPAPPDLGMVVGEGLLENRYLRVGVSRLGEMTLDHKRTREQYTGLSVLEDEPEAGDTYTHSRGRGRATRGGQPASQAILAAGPLVGALEVRWTMPSAAGGWIGIRLVAALHADSPVVRLRLDVENTALDHRLRVRFPVGAGGAVVAGAAFGVERHGVVAPDRRRRAIERTPVTAPAQRFVAAASGRRGLAVLAPGFFEYEWTAAQELVVTLIRAVGELSRAGLPERPGHAGWPMPVPLAQEPGPHSIELGLMPFTEVELRRPARLERAWEEEFLPLQAVVLGAR